MSPQKGLDTETEGLTFGRNVTLTIIRDGRISYSPVTTVFISGYEMGHI